MSRAARRHNVGVALFPFLAVLICTMGALIVLLVLLVQQARVDASTIARHTAAPDDRQLRERIEDAQWRRETLEGSRTEKTQELADSRGKLAHLEEHLQRLQERAKELLERARLIDQGSQLRAEDLAVIRDELARVQAQIEEQKKKIDGAKKDAGKESWYALVPYVGPQGTRRRPIYLECTEQGVIVQPEGLLLRAQDFQGPLGPGNPLDAALRIIRAHLEQVHGAKAGQPYPLVIVRPSGVTAYGAARSALKSWDDEFGYELIGDDKRLDFGTPDPALAAALERTVAVARQKQAAMAAMMPRHFQDEEPPQSFATEPSAVSSSSPAGGGLGTGNRIGMGSSGMRAGSGGSGAFTSSGPNGAYGAGLAGSGTFANGNQASSGVGGTPGAGPGGSLPGSTPGTSAAGPALGSAANGFASGSPSVGGSSHPASGSAGTTGQPTSDSAGGSRGSSSGQPIPAGASPGGAGGGGALGPSQPGGQPVPNLPVGQANSRSPNNSPASNTSGAAKSGSTKAGKSRGRNWALTGAKPHAIGVTRPLHVAVLADRLVIVPDRGDTRAPVVVPISPELRPDDVTRFVTAVQREIQDWGLAVADGYWKPVLHVDVAASAERQFAELQTALDGSGFEVVRKQP